MASKLDTLLEKENITLEQILDEENILFELKGVGSSKFGKLQISPTTIFLSIIKDPNLYVKMIDYITLQEREEDLQDSSKMRKYSYYVSEILAQENPLLIDFLFEKQPDENQTADNIQTANDDGQEALRIKLLPKLLDFLHLDCLNVTSASYFSKSILAIIQKRGYNLLEFISSKPQIGNDLMKHLDIVHIAEIIEHLILLDTNQDLLDENQIYLFFRTSLLKRVLNLAKEKSYHTEIVENAAYLFHQIVQKGINSSTYSNNKATFHLIDQINKPLILFNIGMQSQNAQILQVLIQLVEFSKNRVTTKDQDEVVVEVEQPQIYSREFIEIIPKIRSALQSKNILKQRFTASSGNTVIPLTSYKLTLINLIYNLLWYERKKIQFGSTQDREMLEAFADHDQFGTIHELLLTNPFNNQLQIYYDKIMQLVFNNSVYINIQTKIVENKLLEFVISGRFANNYDYCLSKLDGLRGNMIKIANMLNDKIVKNEKPFEQIQVGDDWKLYVSTILAPTNQLENSFLCGINPKKRFESEDEPQIADKQSAIYQPVNENDNKPESNENEQGEPDHFEDCQEPEEDNQKPTDQFGALYRKNSSEEEIIDEKIQEAIKSPKSQPSELSQLIDYQEKIAENPVQAELKTEQEVNQYWKNHEASTEEVV